MVMSGQERVTSSSALVDDYNSACVDMLMSYMCHTHVRVSFSSPGISPSNSSSFLPPREESNNYRIYIDSKCTL